MESLAAERETVGLALQLYGPCRLSLGGDDVTPRSRKARALLAYLACSRQHSAPRERLAELLWSDRGQDQARASLRQALAELRASALGTADLLVVDRDSVGFPVPAQASDIARIEAAARNGDLATLARLLEHCHVQFLEDLDGISPGFDDWLRAERVRHQDALVFATIAAVETALGHAHKVDINTILSALERLDPGNEDVVRIGLRVDHQAGDTASLHRRYRRLVDQLAREFGTRPSEETRALFEKLSKLAPAGTPQQPAAPLAPTAAAGSDTALTEPPVILVSPLATVDGASDVAALADMCTDDIRVALGQFGDLRVLALDAIDADRLAAVVSTALAGYMLSGRLRRADTELRINIQLANIATGLIVWSEQLRVSPGALGDAVDQIVLRAAGAVMPAIERDLAAQLPKSRRSDDDLVTLYARARQGVRAARNFSDGSAGARLLEAVIAADPTHIGARLLLARLYNSDFWQTIAGHDSAAFRACGLALVLEAAAVEPHNPQVQLRLAWCHLRRRDWDLARRGFENVLAQLPYDADAMNEVAHGLLYLGDTDRAEATMQRAFRLNPFPPADYHADYALILALQRDAASAESHFAVSGENGLIYRMLRLANRWHLAGDAEPTRQLAAQVHRDFAAIWQGAAPATDADIAAWLEGCVVLRRDADRDYLAQGLMAALSHAP